jgi:transposase
MILPFSRMTFVWPVLICDQSAWVAAHVAAFSFFGAVPRPHNPTGNRRSTT